MGKLVRTFFAIEIDENIRRDINKIIHHLRKQQGAEKVKWVTPDKLHVTVRFLGEIDTDTVEKCLQKVIKNLEATKIFQIEYPEVFTFPSHRPRIIAVRVNLSQEFADMLRAIEFGVVDAGIEPETRTPLPHVTLGRLRSTFTPALEKLPVQFPFSHVVEHITLFRSDFVENHSVYSVIKRIKLSTL